MTESARVDKLSERLVNRLGEDFQANTASTSALSRMSNLGLISKSHNGTRDLYKVFGYDSYPSVNQYALRYLRQDIAKRIVEAYPNACWASTPEITDDEETQDETEFEKQCSKLFRNRTLRLRHYIKRLDIVTGLGRFGVLFIGVRDGKDPREPLQGTFTDKDILFMSPYGEPNIKIHEYDTDPQSPRYGLPVLYSLESGGYGAENTTTIIQEDTIVVHWTRVIHVAEGLLENDVLGIPRLQAVLNRLVDLEKVIGGSAETFFLNSRGALHMKQESNSNLKDPTALENRMEAFSNNLTRFLRTKGIDVEAINFNIADPKNHFEIIMSVIAGTTGIPQRILLGSERGELASSQDENNWRHRVHERRTDFCEEMILRPLIDWFITYGVLPEPQDDYYDISWPDPNTISPLEKADIAVKIAQALQGYLNARGADRVMPPEQFFEEVLGIEYREDDLPDVDDLDNIDEVEPLDEDGQEN